MARMYKFDKQETDVKNEEEEQKEEQGGENVGENPRENQEEESEAESEREVNNEDVERDTWHTQGTTSKFLRNLSFICKRTSF